MQNVDAVGCFEISSLSLGYKALDAVLKAGQFQVLEAHPLSPKWFFVLLQGAEAELLGLDRHLTEITRVYGKEGLIDREVLSSVNPKLLPSMYSLSQQSLEQSLLVVETETVCGALSVANHLLFNDNLKIIELKILRGSGGTSLTFFTGTTLACETGAQDVNALLGQKVRTGRAEVIEEPTPAFRDFFNLPGEV